MSKGNGSANEPVSNGHTTEVVVGAKPLAQNKGGKIGNKGGTGRPSNALRERVKAMASGFTESALDTIKSGRALAVVHDPSHKDWAKVGMWATEMELGKPAQAVAMQAQTELIIRVVKE